MRALLTELANEYSIRFDPIDRRVRCGGHIINLCLEAFLFASSKEALNAAIEEADSNVNATVIESLQAQLQQKSIEGQAAKGAGGSIRMVLDGPPWQTIQYRRVYTELYNTQRCLEARGRPCT